VKIKQKEQEQGLTLLLLSCLKFWMNLRCGIILRTKSQDDEKRKINKNDFICFLKFYFFSIQKNCAKIKAKRVRTRANLLVVTLPKILDE
jgi:hypothetical protein